MKPPEHDTSDGLTNDIILQLIKSYCLNHITLEEDKPLNKVELLSLLYAQTNASEVFRCGYSVKHVQQNPILDALQQADDPEEFIRRWKVLETYSHAKNRTRVIASPHHDNHRSLTIEHYSLNGESIHWLNHCFVWGLLQGIIEGCQFDAQLIFDRQVSNQHYDLSIDNEQSQIDWAKSDYSHQVRVVWAKESTNAQSNIHQVKKDDLLEFLAKAIASDPMKQWKIGHLAELCAYSVRSLQRFLKEQGQTFSKLLIETRLQVAVKLMNNSRMSISEAAFCSGFSDHAHLTRRFKEYYGSPPSAYIKAITGHQL